MDSYFENMRVALKRAREVNDYTQEELAATLGLGTQTVANWEQGIAKPKWGEIFKLKKLYNCNVGYLIGETDGKTYELDFIMKETGLTESAVKAIRSMNKKRGLFAYRYRFIINLISHILTEGEKDLENVAGRVLDFKNAQDQVKRLPKVEKELWEEAYKHATREIPLEYPDGDNYLYSKGLFNEFITKKIVEEDALYKTILKPIEMNPFYVRYTEEGAVEVVRYKDLAPKGLANKYLEQMGAFDLMYSISTGRKAIMDMLNAQNLLAIVTDYIDLLDLNELQKIK